MSVWNYHGVGAVNFYFTHRRVSFLVVGLVGQGSEEMRAAVGRRLASAEFHSSQVALGDASAGEDSPLQSSHRTSTCTFQFSYSPFLSWDDFLLHF